MARCVIANGRRARPLNLIVRQRDAVQMDSDRSFLQDLAIAIGLGLFVAVFYLFAAGGIVASWSAGTAYFLFFFVWMRLFEPPGYWGIVVLAGVSGAIAGSVWWGLADTGTWVAAAGGGALLSALITGAELWREYRNENRAV